MAYYREVLDLRIRFILENAAWSITYGNALIFADLMAKGGDLGELERFATRIFKDWNAHDRYKCGRRRCYHPLDWKPALWGAFKEQLREEILERKKENVSGTRQSNRRKTG